MAIKLPAKFKALAPWFEKHRRDCWKPVVRKGDGDATVSKFAGMPWLADGEPWPTCGCCGGPMWLFLQLDLSDLPKEAAGRFGDGLLQAFFCVEDDCIHGEAEGDPFANTHLLRIVDPGKVAGSGRKPAMKKKLGISRIPPKRIVGWKYVDDFPSSAEQEELGLVYDYRNDNLVCKKLKFQVSTTLEETDRLPNAVDGEKLAGWPGWANISTAYPECPKCGRTMDQVIFQIGYDDNIPIMFGDGGQGHIVQCPKHKEVLAYPWTCG